MKARIPLFSLLTFAVATCANFVNAAGLPVATTDPATSVGPFSARMNATFGANGESTAVGFDIGISTSYGQRFFISTIAGSVTSTTAGTDVASLAPGQTYHYRAVASNSFGVTLGADVAFTALATNALAVSLPATGITQSGATLNGQAGQRGSPGITFFEFGTTTAYGSVVGVQVLPDNVSTFNVSFPASGLASGATYHYRVACSNAFGVSFGDDVTFTTGGASAPAAITLAAESITTTSARVRGQASPNGASTIVFFQYGTTTNYTQSTGAGGVGAGSTPVLFDSVLNGLTGSTVYFYRAVASNSIGITYGGNLSFTTMSAPLPNVATLPPDNIAVTSARLNGSANGNGAATEVYFEYGGTPAYGSFTPTNVVPANGSISFNAALSGLVPGVYHYRAVARNSAGAAFGGDAVFTNVPLAVVQQPTNVAACVGGTATFSVAANAAPAFYQWQRLDPNAVDFANIGGATNAVYTTPVLGATNDGTTYRVVVLIPGARTNSANALLTVIDPGASTVAYDFNSGLPRDTSTFGDAFADAANGVLVLTRGIANQTGTFIMADPAPGRLVHGFTASLKVRIDEASPALGEGFSFNWSPDLPDGVFGEEGAGSGLRVSFDTHDNTGVEAPAIAIFWNTNLIARRAVAASFLARGAVFYPVWIRLTADGMIDVTVGCESVHARVPVTGYAPQAGARFGLGARTGDSWASHSFDDLSIALDLTPFVARPAITNIQRLSPTSLLITGTGTTNQNYALLVSSNFANWTWRTNVLPDANGAWRFTENELNIPRRFYRAVGTNELR